MIGTAICAQYPFFRLPPSTVQTSEIKGYCCWLFGVHECCYSAGGLGFEWGKCCPQNLTNQFPKASASSGSNAIGMRPDEQFKAISRPTSIASVRLDGTNIRLLTCENEYEMDRKSSRSDEDLDVPVYS